jgi:hypothetical protein
MLMRDSNLWKGLESKAVPVWHLFSTDRISSQKKINSGFQALSIGVVEKPHNMSWFSITTQYPLKGRTSLTGIPWVKTQPGWFNPGLMTMVYPVLPPSACAMLAKAWSRGIAGKIPEV